MNVILGLLKKNGESTISKLATETKLNRMFVSGYLSALEEKGVVKSKVVGSAKVYWKPK
ncbi:MAG: helix-turn-helix transcriptional regulator [Candidatus Micrarchaeota archaeon]|nr:helix-turn-helix transcriptional regulator [Candidatus Micrarchaeota archaeon]